MDCSDTLWFIWAIKNYKTGRRAHAHLSTGQVVQEAVRDSFQCIFAMYTEKVFSGMNDEYMVV